MDDQLDTVTRISEGCGYYTYVLALSKDTKGHLSKPVHITN